MKKTKQEMKDKILKEYDNDNIVIASVEGLQLAKLSEFIKQPIDGLLYDLNRSEEVVLTFIDDPKWVNDYAANKVIRELKRIIDTHPDLFQPKDSRELKDSIGE